MVACLCGRIEPQGNEVSIVVLQHPDEAKNAKGSAIIAELGLQQYVRWQGEDFRQHSGLNTLIAEDDVAILFPTPGAKVLQSMSGDQRRAVRRLVVIDASWRKARKIWAMNPQLHSLPQLCFGAGEVSGYRIRKIPREGYLSTVESIVVALRMLEARPGAYQGLIDLFDEMIDFQIEQMGESTYREHYSDRLENNYEKNEKKDSK